MKRVPLLLVGLMLLAPHAQAQASSPNPAPAAAPTDFRATVPTAHPSSKFAPPTIREARLQNGIRVLVVERHELPLVALKVVSDIGESESPDGVPWLAADVATSATHAHFSWELGHEFQLIGASYDASSSLDGTRIDLHFLAPHLGRALELAAEVATDANFVSALLDPARVAGSDARHEATRWPAITLAGDLFPETHPFHTLGWGTDASISRAEPAALDAFWKRAFVANHMTLVVVGDVKLDDVVALASKHFGRISPSAEVAPAPAALVATTPRKSIVVVDQPNVAQVHVAVGSVAIDRKSPDYLRLVLLSGVLGSRVYAGTRNAHGYTYGVHTFLEEHRGSGLLLIQGAIELGNAAQSLRDIFAAAANLSSLAIGDEELARAKSRVRSGWASAFETNAGTAATLATFAQLGEPIAEIDRRNQELDALTANDVLAVAQTYLDPKKLHVVVVGGGHDLTTELAPLGLGPVEIRSAPPHAK